jgi:hypothetical protein
VSCVIFKWIYIVGARNETVEGAVTVVFTYLNPVDYIHYPVNRMRILYQRCSFLDALLKVYMLLEIITVTCRVSLTGKSFKISYSMF